MPNQTLVMNDWLNNVLDRERAETMNGQQLAPIKRTLMMYGGIHHFKVDLGDSDDVT